MMAVTKGKGKLFAATLALMVLGAGAAWAAGIRKETSLLTIAESATESETLKIAGQGTIRLARAITPNADSVTFNLYSWNGPEIGEILVASATLTTTGTSTLSNLVNVPVTGEMRLRATASADEDGDREYRVLLFIENE